MNKNTKQKSKFKFKGVILGTSQPIKVTPLKEIEKHPQPTVWLKKKLVKVKTKQPWKPRPKSHKPKSAFKVQKADVRKAKAYGTGLAQANWGKGIFTGIFSGGGIETNRRKH
jgi:hypothetical protein